MWCAQWHPITSLVSSYGKNTKLATLHAHKQTVFKTRWNMNGNWLLSTLGDQLAKLFDIRMMKEVQLFRGHKHGRVASVSRVAVQHVLGRWIYPLL